MLRSARGGVRVRFSAAKFHLVAAAPGAGDAARHGGRRAGPVRSTSERPTLYTLFDSETYGEHVLTFEAETPGLSLFSATFG